MTTREIWTILENGLIVAWLYPQVLFLRAVVRVMVWIGMVDPAVVPPRRRR